MRGPPIIGPEGIGRGTMNKSTFDEEDLWTYVHGESDAQTRAAIDRALRLQPELATMERAIRALHTRLQLGLSASTTITEADVTSQITQAWDREHGVLHLASPSPDATVEREPVRKPRFGIWHFGMAIAACLAIVMGVQTLSPPDALLWQDISLVGARAAHTDAVSYSSDELSVIQELLSQKVGEAYTERHGILHPAAMWTLASSVHAQPDLSFTLIVRAGHRRDKSPEKSWSQSFDTLEDYKMQVGAFASDIAEGLTEEH